MYDSEKLQRDLLHPVTPDEFFSKYAKKQVLHIPGDVSKVERLLGRTFGLSELTSLLSVAQQVAGDANEVHGITAQLNWYEGASDGTFGRVRDQKTIQILPGEAGRAIEQRIPGALAVYLHDIGLYDQALGDFANAWMQAMRLIPGDKPLVVFFFRGDVGIGVAPHFDSADVVQVMLTGRKRWRVSASPVVDRPPLAAYRTAENTLAFDTGQPVLHPDTGEPLHLDDVEWVEFETGPGDLLYLPAGTVHTTENLVSGSLGMSLFVDPLRRVTLFETLTRQFFAARPEVWAECLPGELSDAGCDVTPAVVSAFVERGLQDLADFCRDELGEGLLYRALQPPQYGMPAGDEEACVTPQTRLRRNPRLSILRPTEEGLVLHILAQELLFSEVYEFGFAHGVHRTFGEFTASHAQSWSVVEPYDWQVVQPMLASLVELGVLSIVANN